MPELGRLEAIFTANTQDFEQKTKLLEFRIAHLKDRIKEVKAEAASPLRANMLDALQGKLKIATAELKTFQKQLKNTKVAGSAMGQDLSSALGTVSPRLGALAASAGPLTLLAGSLVAVGAAGAGIYKLATFSQQLGAEIFDLSQKINFSAETLSSLKIAAELSGGSLESLSTSLGIFDRNMEEANDKTSEMSRIFKALKIDTDDNEKSLRQAFTALMKMPAGYQQTALAMKLFGRSGKEIIGVIKETGGNVDGFIDKMRNMGLVITSDGAQKADKFGDELTLLQNKLAAVGRQIGAELVPVVSKASDDISGWLKDNQGEIAKTAKELGSLVSTIYNVAKEIASITPIVITFTIVKRFLEERGPGGTHSDLLIETPYNTLSGSAKVITLRLGCKHYRTRFQYFRPRPPSTPRTFSPFANPQGPNIPALDYGKLGGSGGSGRGGGGGGAQKDILEGLKREVMSLNTEFRKLDVELLNSANMTELAAEKEKILSAVMSQLNAKTQMTVSQIKDVDQALDAAIGNLPKKSQAAAEALRQQALAQFKSNEQTRIAAELTKSVESLAKDWKQATDNARTGADEYTIAIQELDKAYREYGRTLDAGQKKELEQEALRKRQILALYKLLAVRADFGERMQESVDSSIISLESGAISKFRDFLTIEPPDLSELSQGILAWREKMREQMNQLGNDLTNIFADSIHTGFDKGAKAGLATFAQGLLRIVEDIFLARLAKGLGDILGGLSGASGSGGGGFFSGLLRAIFGGAVKGAAGGAAGGIGGGGGGNPLFGGDYATGGYLKPGEWGMAGERGPERIYGGQAGMTVIPHGESGQQTVINATFNLPQNKPGSYQSPLSQRAQAMRILAALQGARK